MESIHFKLTAIGLLGILLCLTASAANEATYTPDGVLEIPYLHIVNDSGQTVSRYAATLQNISSDWTFGIASLTDLEIPETPVTNEATYTSGGTLYIPHARLLDAQGQTLRNFAVFMRRLSPGWDFKIYGLTDLDAPPVDPSTNATTNVTVDVAGTWNMSFHHKYNNSFNGTEFSRSTNSPPPTPDILTMTLEQDDVDVTGTGTLDAVEYTLSGQISGDLFSFSILSGQTNSTMGLISGHVAVTEDSMGGDYFATRTNTTAAIKSGPCTADKN